MVASGQVRRNSRIMAPVKSRASFCIERAGRSILSLSRPTPASWGGPPVMHTFIYLELDRYARI